jgi:hypothetical protein
MIYDPILTAINNLVPNAQVTCMDSFDGIKWKEITNSAGDPTGQYEKIPENVSWNDHREFPSKLALDNEYKKVVEEHTKKEYQRLRQSEYPPLADLADAMYWQSQGDDSKMTAYLSAVEAVKIKYPKE